MNFENMTEEKLRSKEKLFVIVRNEKVVNNNETEKISYQLQKKKYK